jgi:hypothetical protein
MRICLLFAPYFCRRAPDALGRQLLVQPAPRPPRVYRRLVNAPWVKHYQAGVPAEIELPTESLVALYERSVREAGPSVACEFFGRTTTYTQIGRASCRERVS